MKFTLTTKEAIDLVRKSFNLPDEVEVVIIPDFEIAAGSTVGIIRSMSQFQVDGMLSIRLDKKINAIKHLRELRPGLSLVDAKHLVESWPKVILFVEENKRFPDMVTNGTTLYLK
jgi:ribosomal protein L7/L12